MEIDDKNLKKDRQLDNLVNLVENHTRTERHLEQYSEIGDKENKEHAKDIQDIREDEIDNLRNKLNEMGITNVLIIPTYYGISAINVYELEPQKEQVI